MKIILIFIFTILFDLSYSEEVNIFTTRHYESDFDLYSKFTKETGIKVNIVSGKSKPLEKRIIEESDNCIGDIFILADAGRLMSAEKKGLFKLLESDYFKTVVSSNFRTNSKRCKVNPFVWYVFFSTLATVALCCFKTVTEPVVSW